MKNKEANILWLNYHKINIFDFIVLNIKYLTKNN